MPIIREVTSRKELLDFIKFPYSLYSKNPYWIPPLDMDEINTLRQDINPAFAYCEAKYWLAYNDEGHPVGRIAAIINKKYIEKNHIRTARFGWIDFVDDRTVAHCLLEQAESWAKSMGMDYIHGPLGFTDMDKEGLLVEGFDQESVFIAIYNHPYYPPHIESYGFSKDADWIEYSLRREGNYNQRIIDLSNKILKRCEVSILELKKIKDVKPYAESIMDVLNQAYKDLYGVIALSEEQIDAYIKQYIMMLNPNFVKVILDRDKNVAAFVIAIPSLTKAFQKANGRLLPWGWYYLKKALYTNDTLDICLIGVRPDMQRKGLSAVLFSELLKAGYSKNIVQANTFPILENNYKVHEFCEYFQATQTKRRRCYIKKIDRT